MAAFGVRHVELDNIGCGKKRVMKPPGGDTHELFGVESSDSPTGHLRVLKPPGGGTSDIFSSDVDTTPIKPRSSVASPPHPVSAVLPHEDTNGVENGGTTPTPSEGSSPSPPPPQTKTVQPNPVTGQGYSETDSTPTRPKQRVPPGGYASKLW